MISFLMHAVFPLRFLVRSSSCRVHFNTRWTGFDFSSPISWLQCIDCNTLKEGLYRLKQTINNMDRITAAHHSTCMFSTHSWRFAFLPYNQLLFDYSSVSLSWPCRIRWAELWGGHECVPAAECDLPSWDGVCGRTWRPALCLSQAVPPHHAGGSTGLEPQGPINSGQTRAPSTFYLQPHRQTMSSLKLKYAPSK